MQLEWNDMYLDFADLDSNLFSLSLRPSPTSELFLRKHKQVMNCHNQALHAAYLLCFSSPPSTYQEQRLSKASSRTWRTPFVKERVVCTAKAANYGARNTVDNICHKNAKDGSTNADFFWVIQHRFISSP